MHDTAFVVGCIILGAILCAAYLAIVVWAVADAERRGKSGCLVALLIIATGPIGLIAWLLFRPEQRQ